MKRRKGMGGMEEGGNRGYVGEMEKRREGKGRRKKVVKKGTKK